MSEKAFNNDKHIIYEGWYDDKHIIYEGPYPVLSKNSNYNPVDWAANSAGKVRAIVNTQHFEQAIQQEVCTKTSTRRCSGDCGCEQKYKWHRLLAYDPDNDCRGTKKSRP